MPNTLITPSIVAREAIVGLKNNMVMGNLVHRAHEKDFLALSNGNKVGSQITVRAPVNYEVTDGATLNSQDTVEGSVTFTLNKRKHVAFNFTSQDLTLKIADFSERFMKRGLAQLANQIDMDLMALYAGVPNWTGTPGQTINSFADFGVGVERANELAWPAGDRFAVLSPSDHMGMLTSLPALAGVNSGSGEDALRREKLGTIAGFETYQAQNIKTHTCGTRDATTPLVNGANQYRTYGDASVNTSDYVDGAGTSTTLVKDVAGTSQTLVTDGWDASVTLTAGDVFTIAGVYAVNPVSKETLPFLQQFTVLTAATASGAGAATLTITPAIIVSGPYQTVSAAPADDAAITPVGSASTGYRQNLYFHRNAFGLVMVPLDIPPGASGESSRETYDGLSVRVIPVYDGNNDKSVWRLDVLYGVKCLSPMLALRASGTA